MIPPPRFFRPSWVEVELGRLRENLRRFRSGIPRRVRILFVVKADAYGHGAVVVSRAAEASGAVSWLGVSSVEEGVLLREAGIRSRILILGSLYPFESFRAAVRCGLTPTVASLEAARRLVEACRKSPRAPVPCHVKLDTGMGRIGMGWPSGRQLVDYLSERREVALEGVYTHLARAETDRRYTALQLGRFRSAARDIRNAGLRVPLLHAANSAAALSLPASRWDMVRPGLAMYGLYGRGFKPVLSLKSRVVFIKNVGAGTAIGYGGSHICRRPARIATLPIGYADGVPRVLSNRAQVLVHGGRCPIVGTITMDMMMVDVTGVPRVRVGDEVVLVGRSGREEVSVSELARLAGTVPYEIVTRLSSRLPRVYG